MGTIVYKPLPNPAARGHCGACWADYLKNRPKSIVLACSCRYGRKRLGGRVRPDGRIRAGAWIEPTKPWLPAGEARFQASTALPLLEP